MKALRDWRARGVTEDVNGVGDLEIVEHSMTTR